MSKSDVYYDPPKMCVAKINSKFLTMNKRYKIVSEYHCSVGEVLYSIADDSRYENLYDLDSVMIIGDWMDAPRKVDVVSESGEE